MCVQCPEEWGLPLGVGSMGQVVEREWEGTPRVNTDSCTRKTCREGGVLFSFF